MSEHPRAFALLSAQLRTHGATITPNVVDGHNIVVHGHRITFHNSGPEGETRPALLRRMREIVAELRNPIDYSTKTHRYHTVLPVIDDGEPAGMLGITDTWQLNSPVLAWVLPEFADQIIAGLADDEITRDQEMPL